MWLDEEAVTFECQGETLVGVLSRPARPPHSAVLIVVGGPQTRVGSHRQFVHLSRHLAACGLACLRFDYRGMGDSTGAIRDFESVQDDIRCAMDTLCRKLPGIRQVALWGLCDGASAACFYAATDSRVTGLVMANPWVHTEAGSAEARVKHYYFRRMASRDFWQKLASGRVAVGRSLNELGHTLRTARNRKTDSVKAMSLPERVSNAISQFRGRALIVLSGNDLTADEFKRFIRNDRRWSAVTRHDLPDANHTFASAAWRLAVAKLTCEFLKQEEAGNA